jgi:hypothetical protein
MQVLRFLKFKIVTPGFLFISQSMEWIALSRLLFPLRWLSGMPLSWLVVG